MAEERVDCEVTIKVIVSANVNDKEQFLEDIQEDPTEVFEKYHRINDVKVEEF
ncbi:hypothetical protein [Staphylococcus warneri]|uniref:hypothetical protein n=1 Tax=Staphylococcus warneri TaxID=1292 RepID=UPI0003137D3A|nr:hypothetical protein [Staphylococcus warneri]